MNSMTNALVLDIEGTTTSISFVKVSRWQSTNASFDTHSNDLAKLELYLT